MGGDSHFLLSGYLYLEVLEVTIGSGFIVYFDIVSGSNVECIVVQGAGEVPRLPGGGAVSQGNCAVSPASAGAESRRAGQDQRRARQQSRRPA